MEIKATIDHKPTPVEMAVAFWHMDSVEMAKFFNELAELSESKLVMQLQYLTDEPRLNRLGRDVMRKIGEYAEAKP